MATLENASHSTLPEQPHLATKTDLEQQTRLLIMWGIGAMIALFVALFSALTALLIALLQHFLGA